MESNKITLNEQKKNTIVVLPTVEEDKQLETQIYGRYYIFFYVNRKQAYGQNITNDIHTFGS